jgi:hypothetical protein
MSMTNTMRWMSRSARDRAEAMGHQIKDRALQMRLERAAEENERLRAQNETLRDTVEESRADHSRILELLESRLATVETGDDVEVDIKRKSHRGRRFLFLIMLGGGAWAWMRSKAGRGGDDDLWGDRPTSPSGAAGSTGTGTTGTGTTGTGGTSGDPGMNA